ncbi:thioesterase family protein [Penicillium brasilianum]|uniref:Thioesterase family protein n=1 Tax=Penicillium brasilianum TaxID=104259 RepID=A0A1S9RA54_PENBI|nr:thioesterase family protein [Penicillium brasilianum]
MAAKMPSLAQATKWLLRPSTIQNFKPVSLPAVLESCLHQHGPSRSAVVHEQALPQAQTPVPPVEGSPFFTQSQTKSSSNQAVIQDDTTSLDAVISQLPLVQSLRQSRKAYKESRPHLAIPPAIRQHHFVGGSLAGSGKLALAPYMWTSSQKTKTESGNAAHASSVISVFHIGRDLCGHPGFVHGGLLSVLFDEVFARCVSAAFPSGLGMTANLNVDFRKPALPDRLYVLRAETTKVEGRKAWVEGKMTYLPLPLSTPLDAKNLVPDVELLSEDNEGAVRVSEARALFVEPKFADSMVSVYRT